MSESDPNNLGHRQRLRERFLKSGLDGFADYEVVELLLTLAIPRLDVKQAAKALIARFANLRGILDAPIEDLQAVKGIGSVTPAALKIIKAAATLYLQQNGEHRDSLAGNRVAVGTAVTRRPPHRPVLAALPHTVPTLDSWRQESP